MRTSALLVALALLVPSIAHAQSGCQLLDSGQYPLGHALTEQQRQQLASEGPAAGERGTLQCDRKGRSCSVAGRDGAHYHWREDGTVDRKTFIFQSLDNLPWWTGRYDEDLARRLSSLSCARFELAEDDSGLSEDDDKFLRSEGEKTAAGQEYVTTIFGAATLDDPLFIEMSLITWRDDSSADTGSPLRAALAKLASATVPSWSDIEELSALALSPAGGYGAYRTSKDAVIILQGFGTAPLPDGKVGADAGSRQGNEGEARILFAGAQDEVHVIVVNKFYARPDYAEVIRNQILPTDDLVRVDGDCRADAPISKTEPTRYWLVLDEADIPLLVSAEMEEGGRQGPGSTIFEFRRGGARVEIPQC